MRVLVFFDLPVLTAENRRNYNRFRKFLLKNGFMMLQESVYAKLALNATVAESIENNVKKAHPPVGLVEMITITEKQYSKKETLVGEHSSNVIESDERLVVL